MEAPMWALASFFIGTALAAPPIDPFCTTDLVVCGRQSLSDESAYQVEDISFSDGVCAFNLTDGALVPVYSGKAPLSEQMVGLAFVGKSEGESLSDRGDSLSFPITCYENSAKICGMTCSPFYQQTPYPDAIDQGLFCLQIRIFPNCCTNSNPLEVVSSSQKKTMVRLMQPIL